MTLHLFERVAVEDEGEGDPVVCVHGLSRQARDFDVLAQALAPHARVLCVDMAGRGQSDWLAEPMDYQVPTYVADIGLAKHLSPTRSNGLAALLSFIRERAKAEA